MKRSRKGLILGIAVIAAVVLVFAGYHIYRYPAMFRNLTDRLLDDPQAGELREEIQREGAAEILQSSGLYLQAAGNRTGKPGAEDLWYCLYS